MAAQRILFDRVGLFHFSLIRNYSAIRQQFIASLNEELSTIRVSLFLFLVHPHNYYHSKHQMVDTNIIKQL